MTRTYSELITFDTFDDRFDYLSLSATVGEDTFGFNRWLNQILYTSKEWRMFRRDVIMRDLGLDLGVVGYEIGGVAIVHHLNPLTKEQVLERNPVIFDMENVILTSLDTHNAIHYGDKDSLAKLPTERAPFDTCPWKR